MGLSRKGFTIIELLVAVSIFSIIVMMTYVNYAYSQNITKVKTSLKEISQSINEARNMAIFGFERNGINQSIGVYFDLDNKNVIKFYSFNYNSGVVLSEANLIKERRLQDHVGLDSISGKRKVMIYFSSVYARPEIYYFDGGVQDVLHTDELNFEISFRGASSYPLKRSLKYFKNTNVVDY